MFWKRAASASFADRFPIFPCFYVTEMCGRGAGGKRFPADRENAAADRNAFQTVAPKKSAVAYFFDAVGDCDPRQTFATVKCGAFDCRYVVANRDHRKAPSIPERRITDGQHAVGDGDPDQSFAFGKRVVPDFLYAVGNYNAFQTVAGIKCAPRNLRYAVGDDAVVATRIQDFSVFGKQTVSDAFVVGVILIHNDPFHFAASSKRIVSDLGDICGKTNFRKSTASEKGFVADFFDFGRKG